MFLWWNTSESVQTLHHCYSSKIKQEKLQNNEDLQTDDVSKHIWENIEVNDNQKNKLNDEDLLAFIQDSVQ